MAASKMASLYNVLAKKPKSLLWDTEQHTAFVISVYNVSYNVTYYVCLCTMTHLTISIISDSRDKI